MNEIRRTEAQLRVCSQIGCPGDGRYMPPGRGHLLGCAHNAVAWVWETAATSQPPEDEGERRGAVGHEHRWSSARSRWEHLIREGVSKEACGCPTDWSTDRAAVEG